MAGKAGAAKAADKETPAVFTPKVVKHVTMPTLKLQPDEPVYVTILEKMFEGKPPKKKEGEEQKKAPTIINVISYSVNAEGTALETDGEVCQMVAGAVVESELREEYENDGYVGKTFMIVKGKKKGTTDRSYFTYTIQEIEAPAKAA